MTPTPLSWTTEKRKVSELIKQEGDDSLALRVAVRPGGCSGFKYSLNIEDKPVDDDMLALALSLCE